MFLAEGEIPGLPHGGKKGRYDLAVEPLKGKNLRRERKKRRRAVTKEKPVFRNGPNAETRNDKSAGEKTHNGTLGKKRRLWFTEKHPPVTSRETKEKKTLEKRRRLRSGDGPGTKNSRSVVGENVRARRKGEEKGNFLGK